MIWYFHTLQNNHHDKPDYYQWPYKWRRKWQPTSVVLPGESHGQRSLEGYCPWSRTWLNHHHHHTKTVQKTESKDGQKTQIDISSKKTYKWTRGTWKNVKEMQIKTTMRCHLKLAIIKKYTNNKFWRGCGEKGTLLYCWWECKLVQSLWRTVWRYHRILQSHSWAYIQGKHSLSIHAPPCSLQHCLQ